MRKKFLTSLYLHSQQIYTKFFKSSKEWKTKRKDLLAYHPGTLGYQLGSFLEEHQFDLIPKVEQHDIYHILTGYGVAVEEEVALQFLCFGNGKRSLYLAGAVLIGMIVLPDYLPLYLRSFRKGKRLQPFYQYDYRNMLEVDFHDFQQMIHCKQSNPALKMRLKHA